MTGTIAAAAVISAAGALLRTGGRTAEDAGGRLARGTRCDLLIRVQRGLDH